MAQKVIHCEDILFGLKYLIIKTSENNSSTPSHGYTYHEHFLFKYFTGEHVQWNSDLFIDKSNNCKNVNSEKIFCKNIYFFLVYFKQKSF